MSEPNIELEDCRFIVTGTTATQLHERLAARVNDLRAAFWPDSEVTCRISIDSKGGDVLTATCWMFDRIRESPDYPTIPGEDGPVVVPPAPKGLQPPDRSSWLKRSFK